MSASTPPNAATKPPCPHCGKPYRTLLQTGYGVDTTHGVTQGVPAFAPSGSFRKLVNDSHPKVSTFAPSGQRALLIGGNQPYTAIPRGDIGRVTQASLNHAAGVAGGIN